VFNGLKMRVSDVLLSTLGMDNILIAYTRITHTNNECRRCYSRDAM